MNSDGVDQVPGDLVAKKFERKHLGLGIIEL